MQVTSRMGQWNVVEHPHTHHDYLFFYGYILPKTPWCCFSSPSPSKPNKGPASIRLRSHAYRRPITGPEKQKATSWEGGVALSVRIEKVPLVLSSILSSNKNLHLPLKYQVTRKKKTGLALPSNQGTGRHTPVWFSSLYQLVPPAERKQSLSKSQLSLCLFRKISIKDKANFN